MSTTTTTAPLLDIRGLSHSYGEVAALRDISLSIADNEFFALLGPSGCGKTTLLRAIAGFETPSAGSILLDGDDLTSRPAHRRPINMMFQSYALFPHMTVAQNIAYGLEADGVEKAEIRRRVGEMLDIIGLSEFERRRPAKLSGGQRQRVALARALVKRPRLLLLDEPLSALDRKVRAEMQLELKRMQHEVGMTFVVVTHDQEEAMSMADRVAVLNRGAIEQLDSPVGLYSSPSTRFVANFIGSANLIDGTAVAGGITTPEIGFLPAAHAFASGDPVTLVLRPEDVRIAGTDGAIEGTVVDTFFLGGSSTVSVTVPGLPRPISCTVHAAHVAERGERVGLSYDRIRAVVVANPGSAEAPVA
ncbi:spermidine/putrescine ABC transporter ATP-binding protein [Leifsonia sp. Root4]|uniref:ABC transporter ATP-binding protein n=1 Tax=Leifsonia sp. Root4 TaxID=1736525 RepID=UPI000700FE26|nr:ABC transporter ATP-binding protein [Leifsonia sp. Root4]KQW04727.1 spermidine/putrescine ABC transporter ATP-binding protein [Leifsonia sp. Root4]